MTVWTATFVGCRIVAVYAGLQSVLSASTVLANYDQGGIDWQRLLATAPVAVFALILWGWADKLAWRVADDALGLAPEPEEEEEEEEEEDDEDTPPAVAPGGWQSPAVLAIAFVILGLVFVGQSVTGITFYLIDAWSSEFEIVINDPRTFFERISKAGMISSGVRLAIGVWLIVGSRTLVRWFDRVRVKPVEDGVPDVP